MGAKRRQKTSPRKIHAAKRRADIMKLREDGLTYEEIGKRVGISAVGAYKHVKKVLDEQQATMLESADEVRAQELRRLDRATVRVMKRIEKGELPAVDRLIRIQERRARYLGLDAPEQIDHTVGPGPLKTPVVLLPPIDGHEPARESTAPLALPDASREAE